MHYCSICGKPTQNYTCNGCKNFQDAVARLVSQYEGEVPAPALSALNESVSHYNTFTGMLLTNERAKNLREQMRHAIHCNFYNSFLLPSMRYPSESSFYGGLIHGILESGLLPADLTTEVQAYVETITHRKTQLCRILTYQTANGHWEALTAESIAEATDEQIYTGKTEEDALEKLYQAWPDLRPTSVPCK